MNGNLIKIIYKSIRYRLLPEYIKRSLNLYKIIAFVYGHDKSVIGKRPVDNNNKYIPWYTYPAIEYLNSLDFSKLKIFEWGSGYSSVYWSKKAKSVVSMESNSLWAKKIKKIVKNGSLKIVLKKRKDSYVNFPISKKNKYDLVIIDGDYRPECAKVAPRIINKSGIIIFDNSDWYPRSVKYLSKYYFRVDFSGLGPSNNYCWTTSMFFNSQKLDNKIKFYGTPKPLGGRDKTFD